MHKVLYAAIALALPGNLLGSGDDDGLPHKEPTAVGMSATRLAAIDRIVARGIQAGGFPGAAVSFTSIPSFNSKSFSVRNHTGATLMVFWFTTMLGYCMP